jgi:dynein heavy chain
VEGINTMTDQKEENLNKIFDNLVPEVWKKISYPSEKALASWIDDLSKRVKFLENWIDNGVPKVIWLGAFFSP